MKIVLVTWLDAARGDGSVDEIPHGKVAITRNTVGWLLERTKEGLVIAMSRDEQSFERWFTIPARYVRSVKTLADA